MTNVQRKTIVYNKFTLTTTGLAFSAIEERFESSDAVNVHGLRASITAAPFGPDEHLIGRWYVVMLPPSVAADIAIFNAWKANLATPALANAFTESSELIWGSGIIHCSDQTPYHEEFAPKTSRTVQKGSALFIIVTVDEVSGVVDDFDITTQLSLFTS